MPRHANMAPEPGNCVGGADFEAGQLPQGNQIGQIAEGDGAHHHAVRE